MQAYHSMSAARATENDLKKKRANSNNQTKEDEKRKHKFNQRKSLVVPGVLS